MVAADSLAASFRCQLDYSRRMIFIGLAWSLLAASSGCNLTPREVWVFIDNAGAKPLVVTVDGKEAAKVAPGEFAKLSYLPGEHQFHITSGDEVVCDMTRNLERSDRTGVCRKYLFNPDKNNRYQTYQAKYGANRLEGVMQTGLLKYQKDPLIKRQYIYRQLLKEIKLLPSDAWNDITGIDYVLISPPAYIVTRGTGRRTVLARMEPQLYDRLTEMARIENPSDEDIDSLDELIDEILSAAP